MNVPDRHVRNAGGAGRHGEAAACSRSPLFSGAAVPVVARFSVAGGNPDAHDAERSLRRMALEVRLPDGSVRLARSAD